MYTSLNFLKGVIKGMIYETAIGGIKGDTRSLDYGFVEGTGVEAHSRNARDLGRRAVLNHRRVRAFMEKKKEENREPSK